MKSSEIPVEGGDFVLAESELAPKILLDRADQVTDPAAALGLFAAT